MTRRLLVAPVSLPGDNIQTASGLMIRNNLNVAEDYLWAVNQALEKLSNEVFNQLSGTSKVGLMRDKPSGSTAGVIPCAATSPANKAFYKKCATSLRKTTATYNSISARSPSPKEGIWGKNQSFCRHSSIAASRSLTSKHKTPIESSDHLRANSTWPSLASP